MLTLGEVYYFYQNYRISDREELVTTAPPLPRDFFNEVGPLIEINAIAGKNGSGKSTLMDLFLIAVNNYAAQLKYVHARLTSLRGVHLQLYYKFNGFCKMVVSDQKVEVYRYSARLKKMVLDNQPRLEPFFYSIAVNYSHYAYNELDYPEKERWLMNVFHKNDGYQLPVVLNPFRAKGNIDINIENQLIYARLMANLLRPASEDFDARMLTEKARADHLKLRLNESKTSGVLYEQVQDKNKEMVRLKDIKLDRDFILGELKRLYPFRLKKQRMNYEVLALDYIFYKLVTICLRYPAYHQYFDRSEKRFVESLLQEYLQSIIEDPSHIAFKLKQTLNYLTYDHLDLKDGENLNLDDYGKKLYRLSKRNIMTKELIEFLPPPIFRTDIMVRDIITGRTSPFAHLSSGEKQWNYAVSSFLYHLNNLDSIPPKRGRVTYSRVFIILEEVELYFHPEMQRRYLQHVIDSIRHLSLRNIKRVQICFITHSPFILSDIPEQNILFLGKNGLPASEEHITKTFGGNIHELLAKSFFLDEALVGEHARRKIRSFIRYVQPRDEQDQNTLSSAEPENPMELRRQIELIGEDFLREKLLEMFDEKFDESNREKRIRELEEEIRRLRNDRA